MNIPIGLAAYSACRYASLETYRLGWVIQRMAIFFVNFVLEGRKLLPRKSWEALAKRDKINI